MAVAFGILVQVVLVILLCGEEALEGLQLGDDGNAKFCLYSLESGFYDRTFCRVRVEDTAAVAGALVVALAV